MIQGSIDENLLGWWDDCYESERKRERELSRQMPVWRRLFSFYFLELIYESDILNIVRENEDLSGLYGAQRPKDSK